MSINEQTNLVGNISTDKRNLSWKGTLAVFFAALGVFSLATVCARSVFPRVLKDTTVSAPSDIGAASFSKIDEPVFFEDEVLSTLAPGAFVVSIFRKASKEILSGHPYSRRTSATTF